MNKLPSVILLLFLGACSFAAPERTALGPTNLNRVGTELAGPDTFLGQLPVGFVILKPDPTSPGSVDTPRNRAFCSEFAKAPTASAIQSRNAIAENIVRTRWPIVVGNASAAEAADCNFLIRNYDHARARALMQSVELTRGSFAGQGPFLVLISGRDVTAVDGSREADFSRFVRSWDDAINRTQQQITNPVDTGPMPAVLLIIPRFIARLIETLFPPTAIVFGTLRGIVC